MMFFGNVEILTLLTLVTLDSITKLIGYVSFFDITKENIKISNLCLELVSLIH